MTSSVIILSIVQVALDTLSQPNFLSSFKASVRIETTLDRNDRFPFRLERVAKI